MSDPGVVLLVTWDGGGNVPPMLALGRRLARRGHEVRVLGTPSLGGRVGHAGLDFAALGRVAELDRTAGTAMEDQVDAFVGQLAGPELSADVADALDRHRPDAVVIDCMQLAAFNAAETREISTVSLVHYLLCFAAGSGLKIAIPLLNVSRAALGLEPLNTTVGPHEQLWARCNRVLAATLRDFDVAPNPLPANVRYVGPILDPDPPRWEWDLPWPPDHPDPLVVVSFSTTYQHQEEQLQRALDALASLPVRTLVTLGPGLEPADIDAPRGAVVRRWVPHAYVLPHAKLVITHAGHSSVMYAIADAVPMICLPTGRDQLVNARRVADCGLGVALEPAATVEQIRAAVADVLAGSVSRSAVEQMARSLHRLCTSELAVNEVEALMSRPT
jgi:MGT family glycosyltransferase